MVVKNANSEKITRNVSIKEKNMTGFATCHIFCCNFRVLTFEWSKWELSEVKFTNILLLEVEHYSTISRSSIVKMSVV